VVTAVVSLVTRPRPDEELRGLVYALTPRPKDDVRSWHQKPAVFAAIVLALTLVLNFVFA
jgi:SSS family solute:Na+ symporter